MGLLKRSKWFYTLKYNSRCIKKLIWVTYKANFDNNCNDSSYAISSPVLLPGEKNSRSFKNRATAVLVTCGPHLLMERVCCRLFFRIYWVKFPSVAVTPVIDLIPDSIKKKINQFEIDICGIAQLYVCNFVDACN